MNIITHIAWASVLISPQVSDQAAKARAKTFGETIVQRYTNIAPPDFDKATIARDNTVTSVWKTPVWQIETSSMICGVDIADGTIRSFLFSPPLPQRSSEPDQDERIKKQLQTLADEYVRLAGSPNKTKILTTEPWIQAGRRVYSITFCDRIGNVNFPRYPGGTMTIDSETGGLMGLTLRKQVTPPDNLSAKISPDLASASAVSRAFSDRKRLARQTSVFNLSTPSVVEVAEGPELTVWKPNREDSEDGGELLTEAMLAKGQREEGILTYWVQLIDRESYDPKIGTFARRYAANIDAQTGRVVSFAQYRPSGGGIGSHVSHTPVPAAFSIPKQVTSAQVHLWSRGRFLVVNKAGWSRSKNLPGLSPSRPIAIRVGRSYVRGEYHARQNLLVVKTKTETIALSPNAFLRKSLLE